MYLSTNSKEVKVKDTLGTFNLLLAVENNWSSILEQIWYKNDPIK